MNRRTLLNAAALAPAAAALNVPTAAQAQAGAPAPGDAGTRDEALARVLEQRLRAEGVGLVAAVVEGSTVRLAGAGRRSPTVGTAPDGDTLFEYGSITKTFTALLLADLVVRKELALADPVQAVLPQGVKLVDNAGAPITWLDLATHRSGLPRLPGNLRDPTGADPYDYSRRELWAFLSQWKPERPRGAAFEYSNLAYGLLGEALALRAGTSYAALLAERVLRPLGLADMRLALREPPVPGLLPGHDPDGKPVPNWRFDAMAGAGALVGSARSLARYAQAALGRFEHPLKEAFALALRPHAKGPEAANPIGLAWLIGPLNGRRVFNHDGGTAGYSTSLFIDPERQRAALVLANAQVEVTDLGLHLLDPAVPLRDVAAEKRQQAAQTSRPAVAVAPELLRPLAATYALNAQFKLTVRSQEGRLFAQATGQGEFELFGLDPRRFFARVTPLEIHFEGDSGVAPALVLHQAGQRLRFVRE